MQLSLFTPEIKQYPFQKEPNKKEKAILDEVFNGAQYISCILGDVVELYPFKAITWTHEKSNLSLVIGASCNDHMMFYHLHIETGNIYLIHQYSSFPYIKEQSKN